jgi:glucose/mannose-6-phosphate isomerase
MVRDPQLDLDDTKLIERLDKKNMYSYLRSQAEDAFKSYSFVRKKLAFAGNNNNISNIIVAGIGGSGMAPLAINFLFRDELTIPYAVSQTYDLPYYANSKSLIIVVSDSGETEEVISQYLQAKDHGSKIIVISQGSKLKQMAISDNISYYSYSSDVPARASFAFMFGSMLAYLVNLGVIMEEKKDGLQESIQNLKALDEKIGIKIPTENNIAKRTAILLNDYIPLVYTEPPFESLGSRFAKMLNENAGMFSFYNFLPELRHNEIMAWSLSHSSSKFMPIFLLNNIKYSRMNNEISEIIKEISSKSQILQFRAEEGTKISRFFYLQYMMDMISYYLGILKGKDPSETPALKQLKQKLRKDSLIPQF